MNQKILSFKIEPGDAGTRLDRCLSRLIPDSSRTYLQKLITDGRVRGDGESLTVPRWPVRTGMTIEVVLPEAEETTVLPEEFSFPILYEDAMMLVIDKPAGVVVHPAAGNPTGTVVNALLGRYPDLAERMPTANGRPGIVHRLDKDTSGCLVIAKTPEAQFKLGNAFASRNTGKTYLAVLRGALRKESGEIVSLIGRHPVNRQKMAIVERNGKQAVTRYKRKKTGCAENSAVTLAEIDILTGRTHQIRVHMASLGNPVLGDETYGGCDRAFPAVERQMLHAWKLRLPHPGTGEMMTFCAPIPEDMQRMIDCCFK